MTKTTTQLKTQNMTRSVSVMAIIAIMTVSLMTANLPMNAYATHGPSEDLTSWIAENYPVVTGFPDAIWIVDTTSVKETVNGQATVYYSDFDIDNKKITATVEVVTTSDNDFIGFVLGFNPGDTSNASADYLLVDWKQASQPVNFLPNGCDVGDVNAPIGLALSRVSGIPDPDELWSHDNLFCGGPGFVTELARATNLGATGWADNTEVTFDFVFESGRIQVWVDGVLEFDESDDFSGIDGRFGFYDFSQINAEFKNVSIDNGCSSGFWKADAKKWDANNWTTFSPGDDLETILTKDIDPDIRVKGPVGKMGTGDEPTMEGALNAKGGNMNALVREIAAALLNIEDDPPVSYPLTNAELIALWVALDQSSSADIEDLRAMLFDFNHAGCPLVHFLV